MIVDDISKGPWTKKDLATVPLVVDGNGNILCQFYIGSSDETKERAVRDSNFTSMAQQAFEIMMQRGWGISTSCNEDGSTEWFVVFNITKLPTETSVKFYQDPFTAIVETNKILPNTKSGF